MTSRRVPVSTWVRPTRPVIRARTPRVAATVEIVARAGMAVTAQRRMRAPGASRSRTGICTTAIGARSASGQGLPPTRSRRAHPLGWPSAHCGDDLRLGKLRCHLCGELFTAEPPPRVGLEKYDKATGAMVALLKYGSGMPCHRLERLQADLQIPLPASTQDEIRYLDALAVIHRMNDVTIDRRFVTAGGAYPAARRSSRNEST